MNSLRGFLDNASVQLGHNEEGRQYWCPLNVFTRHYYTYCKDSFRQAQPWSEELSAVPFKAMNITTRTAEYVWGPDPKVTGKILLGVCPTIDIEQMKAGVDNMENPIVADQVHTDRDLLAF